jgi:CDGSH-type Zn-finger protein/uncharacterized Fe-S cluster protein YjdI
MSQSVVKHYAGEQLDVTWDSRLCMHAQNCVKAAGDVFKNGRHPWCDPDIAPAAQVKAIVESCPSGALSYQAKDGSSETLTSNSLQVTANGSLDAHGNLVIAQNKIDTDGIKHRASLCRCGASNNKPFCDGSHKQQPFTDAGKVKSNQTTLASLDGDLNIKPATDGPLLVKGKFCIKDAAGNVEWQGEQVALCRCGASHNKPFCDGSHGVIGFKADA